jgi:hypothetical protein
LPFIPDTALLACVPPWGTTIQRQLSHSSPRDHLANGGLLGFNQRSLGRDLDGLAYVSQFERGVHARGTLHLHDHVGTDEVLETTGLNVDFVIPGYQVDKLVVTIGVGGGGAAIAGIDIR